MTDPSPAPAPRRRRTAGLALAGIAVAAIAAAAVAIARPSAPPAELPDYGELAAFELTDQTGAPFGTRELAGAPWIANFIFTRCPTVCPVFTYKMARVQDATRAVGDRLRLVSFSVDPDYDTPEVLRAYADRHGADPSRWRFLTGAPDAVRTTVRDGLKMAMERAGDAGDVPNILHGTHFVLVDGRSHIRGYYDSNDAGAVDRLIRDATALARDAR